MMEIILFYLCLILTFALDELTNLSLNLLIYLVQATIFEIIVYLILKNTANAETCNFFAIIQCFLGTIYKALIFAILAKAEFIYYEDKYHEFEDIANFGFFIVILNIFYQVLLSVKGFRINENCMIVRPLT